MSEDQVRVTFEPILTLTQREDGGWDADIDWSTSLLGVYDETKGTWDDDDEAATEASAALDAWLRAKGDTAKQWLVAAAERCHYCDAVITGVPFRDEGDKQWLPESQWRAWCNEEHHDNDAEREQTR